MPEFPPRIEPDLTSRLRSKTIGMEARRLREPPQIPLVEHAFPCPSCKVMLVANPQLRLMVYGEALARAHAGYRVFHG